MPAFVLHSHVRSDRPDQCAAERDQDLSANLSEPHAKNGQPDWSDDENAERSADRDNQR